MRENIRENILPVVAILFFTWLILGCNTAKGGEKYIKYSETVNKND